MRLLRCGPAGLLVELTGTAEVMAAYRALRAARADGRLAGVAELVPAARTVLVLVEPGVAVPTEAVRRRLLADDAEQTEAGTAESGREAAGSADDADDHRELVIPVHYDGPDLELVAETAGLSVPEVVDLHSSADYTVAFCGFAPGFGYLTGLPEPLHQPRLDDARSSVPAGSVGVAGEFSAVYPRSSPGGWRLLGHTDEVMFDPKADPPARLAPGDRVRFEPVR